MLCASQRCVSQCLAFVLSIGDVGGSNDALARINNTRAGAGPISAVELGDVSQHVNWAHVEEVA